LRGVGSPDLEDTAVFAFFDGFLPESVSDACAWVTDEDAAFWFNQPARQLALQVRRGILEDHQEHLGPPRYRGVYGT